MSARDNQQEPKEKGESELAGAAKDLAEKAAGAASTAAKNVAATAGQKAEETVHDVSEAAKKAAVEKLGGEYKTTGKPKDKTNKKKSAGGGKVVMAIIGIAIIVVVAYVAYGFLQNTQNSYNVTAKNTITSSVLKEAINVDNLSTAEFVYCGIAEHYQDGSDEPDYRISYDATVKAGVRMNDIVFGEPDTSSNTIDVTLPKIIITSASVEVNSLSYMPSDPENSDLKTDLTTCEQDVINEAGASNKFYSYAQDNLKSTIEGLLTPLLQGTGYELNWIEG